MARAGYCAECGASVWLNSKSECVNGHGSESISGVYEVEEQPLTSGEGTLGGQPSAVAPEVLALNREENDLRGALKTAEKSYAKCEKEWNRALEDAYRSLEDARTFGTREVARHAGVVLYEHAVVTPHGTAYFEQEPVTAYVDTAGNLAVTRRATLTRMAAGGLLFGPLGALGGGLLGKKQVHDTRELYLMVESTSVASVIPCDPNHGPFVRQLAMSINRMAPGAAERAAQRAQSTAQWEAQVQALTEQREAALRLGLQDVARLKGEIDRVASSRAAPTSGG